MKRPLRPRPTVPIIPVTLTDEDAQCYPVTGLTARRFREFVSAHSVPMARDGRRILVLVDDFKAAVRAIALSDVSAPIEAAGNEPQTVDEVLARIGRERVK